MACRGAMDNLCMRTLLYFIDNPDEELAPADMRVKFGVNMRNVRRVLQPLLERGLVQRHEDGGRCRTVYRPGPKLQPLAMGGGCQAPQR